jgi:hypothetical protein
MTALRVSAETSRQFDSLKARMARLQATLGPGATTTEQLARADTELAALASEARNLRVSVRQEIAGAKERAREDRAVRRAS